METFKKEDIADYYDQTEVHYRSAWDLEESLALHYGYWRKDTRNFRDSLMHMNEELAQRSQIKASDKVLDAGCGVGGSAVFLAKTIGCEVTGITLSQQQVDSARKNAQKHQLSHLLQFDCKDYTNTGYADNSYDVIWALESVCHTVNKEDFVREAARLLKPGGRLIMSEYLKKPSPFSPREKSIFKNWLHAWAIVDLAHEEELQGYLQKHGFKNLQLPNITPQIKRSSWRMFYGSWYLAPLSALYRLYNPKVRHFADNHYKGAYYQYLALRKGLWQYHLVFGEIPT